MSSASDTVALPLQVSLSVTWKRFMMRA